MKKYCVIIALVALVVVAYVTLVAPEADAGCIFDPIRKKWFCW